jgi:hypothetical protein
MRRRSEAYQGVVTGSNYDVTSTDFTNLDDVNLFRRPRVLISEIDYDRMRENHSVLELTFDPFDRNKILIGDIRLRDKPEALSVPSLSVGSVVAHTFFDGMSPTTYGHPGIFTFYNIRSAAYGGKVVTTAEDLDSISGEDLIMYGGYEEMVILGSFDRGPVFGYTRDEWVGFANEVNNPESRINELVWWADAEASE